jgi:hypothetical protein
MAQQRDDEDVESWEQVLTTVSLAPQKPRASAALRGRVWTQERGYLPLGSAGTPAERIQRNSIVIQPKNQYINPLPAV